MAKPTGVIERRIKLAAQSACNFGYPCDICGQNCTPNAMRQVRSQWLRETGVLYFTGWITTTWGHLACLNTDEFGEVSVCEADAAIKPANYLGSGRCVEPMLGNNA